MRERSDTANLKCIVAGTLRRQNRAVVASVDALGNRSTNIYDAADRTVAVENPLGHRNTSTYDAAGRTTASINPLGYATTFQYDRASTP